MAFIACHEDCSKCDCLKTKVTGTDLPTKQYYCKRVCNHEIPKERLHTLKVFIADTEKVSAFVH